MTPRHFLSLALTPALSLLPSKIDTAAGRAMVIAICLQESKLQHRRQIGGPARGYAQFELNGGVLGVLTHHASADHARAICDILDIKPAPSVVYGALEFQDVLAAAFARLLLWTDPAPLPSREDDHAAWDIYFRTWRPGRPHPETWAAHYRRAWETLTSSSDDRDIFGTPMTED